MVIPQEESGAILVTPDEITTQNMQDVFGRNEPNHYKELESRLLLISSQLFGRMNLSMDAAEATLGDFGEFLEATVTFLRANIKKTCKDFAPHNLDILESAFISSERKIKAAFDKINTECKIRSVLKKKNILELPRKHVFAEKEEQVGDNFVTRRAEAVILPLKNQIKMFLERRGILKAILDHQKELESHEGSINHFLIAERWKKVKEIFGEKTVIPIFLFNVLTAHRTKYLDIIIIFRHYHLSFPRY